VCSYGDACFIGNIEVSSSSTTNMKRCFKDTQNMISHLKEVDESYFRHLGEAWRISAHCLLAASAAFVHGVFPLLLKTTATDLLLGITSRHQKRLAHLDAGESD
jgi:hypothetical protein